MSDETSRITALPRGQLDAAAVLPSAAVSKVFGGSGQDWFWLKASDK